jgi:putative tricarboxylic transport membrane protein
VTTDRIAGSVLVVAGTLTGLEATTFDVAFMTDPVGPKALPFLVAVMLLVAGVRTIARPRSEVALPPRPVALRMGAAALAFLGYAAILPWIGFFLATTLVVAALAMLYRGPVGGSLAAGMALAGTLWLLFVRILALPLPVGDLWIR